MENKIKNPLKTLRKAHELLKKADKLLYTRSIIFNMVEKPDGELIRKTITDIIHDKSSIDSKVNSLIMEYFNK